MSGVTQLQSCGQLTQYRYQYDMHAPTTTKYLLGCDVIVLVRRRHLSTRKQPDDDQ
jgi:hypothetical protein